MVKTFISYTHKPTDTEVTTWLAEELSADGHVVFFDREIPKASDFDRYIKDRLQDCDAFLLVVSRASSRSIWVRAELRVACALSEKNRGRPCIIPLLIEDAADEWPMEWHAFLDLIQHVRCLTPSERPVAVRDVRGVLQKLSGAPGPRPAGPAAEVAASPSPVGLSESVVASIGGLLDHAESLMARRRFDDARNVLRSCEQLAEHPPGLAPASLRVRLYNNLALALAAPRTLDEAMSYALKARGLLADNDPSLQRGHNDHRLGYVHLQRGELYDALKHLEAADAVAQQHGATTLRAQVQDVLGTAWCRLGLLEVALEHYRLSLELKETDGDQQGQAITHGNLGRTYQAVGDHARATSHFEKDLELSLALREQDGVLLMRSHLASLLLEQHRHGESLRAYQDYLRQARDYHLERHVAFAHLGLAQVQTALGLHEEAEKSLAEANREANRLTDVALRARVFRAAGDLAAAREEQAEAVTLYRKAVEAMEECRVMPTELVETLLQTARVHARWKQPDLVESCLRRAEEGVRTYRLRWLHGRLQSLRHRLLHGGDGLFLRPEMPFPLAVLASRVDSLVEAPERLRGLIELFKGALRYATTVALAQYQQLRPLLTSTAVDEALTRAFDQRRPSLGVWAEGLRTVVTLLAEHRPLLVQSTIVDVFTRPVRDHSQLRGDLQDCISRLLAIRNRLTHGGSPRDQAEWLRLTDEIQPNVEMLLNQLRPLWNHPLLAYQGQGGRWRELRGPRSLLHWPVADVAGPAAENGDVYLMNPEDQKWLRLTPWWIVCWRNDPETPGELFHFSKRANARHVYVNAQTSEEYAVPRIASLFPPREEPA